MPMRNVLLFTTLLLIGASAFAAAPLYVETEIQAPPDGPLTAAGLNNNGDIAASSQGNGYIYLHHSNTLYALPHPTPNSSDWLYGINDYGKVAGTSAQLGEPEQATVWYLTGGFEVL